ncbi:MAG: iron ABC transporter permease [Planctomycetota bacterium]
MSRAAPARGLRTAALLAAGLVAAVLAALCFGEARTLTPGTVLGGLAELAGLGRGTDPTSLALVEIRLWRAVTGLLVGASLALSGALLQGLFRNPLAAPSLLGVTSGASLGVAVATLVLAGTGPVSMYVAPLAAFIGAGASLAVLMLAVLRHGRGSVALLLLVGIALSSLWTALVAFVQNLALDRFDVTQVLLRWSFGDLDDRHPEHALLAALCLLPGVAAIPWIARPLDVLALGEDDARTLGVDPARLERGVVLLASAATAGAVAVAGPVAFVGLVDANLVRLATGEHARVTGWPEPPGRRLLLSSTRPSAASCRRPASPPGVAMSLVGAPRTMAAGRQRQELAAW